MSDISDNIIYPSYFNLKYEDKENTFYLESLTLSDLKLWKKSLLIDSSNMAELMLDADLAIGAGGSTSWERCCLSLPTFIFLIDENQQMIVKQLVKFGSVRLLEDIGSLKNNLEDIRNDIRSWTLMTKKSRNICDGLGADRVRNYVK